MKPIEKIMKYTVLIPTPRDGSLAVYWCVKNLDDITWTMEFTEHGLLFRFKKKSDAVWFSLIHSDQIA